MRQLGISQILSALQNVHPLQTVVVAVVLLDGVDEHALGQTALDIVGDREVPGCVCKRDAQLVAALVGFPDAAAQGQRHRKNAPFAGREHPLQPGVDPIRAVTALHCGFQLECRQPGQLGADQRGQVEGQGLRVLVQRQAVDGCIVPILDSPLHPVSDKGLATDDILNICVVYHAF